MVDWKALEGLKIPDTGMMYVIPVIFLPRGLADLSQDAKSSWEVEGAEASKAYECGDLGFEVGQYAAPLTVPPCSIDG